MEKAIPTRASLSTLYPLNRYRENMYVKKLESAEIELLVETAMCFRETLYVSWAMSHTHPRTKEWGSMMGK